MMLACCSHGVNVSVSSSLSLFSHKGFSSIVLPTSSTSSTAAIVTLSKSQRLLKVLSFFLCWTKEKKKRKRIRIQALYCIQRFKKCGSVLKPLKGPFNERSFKQLNPVAHNRNIVRGPVRSSQLSRICQSERGKRCRYLRRI